MIHLLARIYTDTIGLSDELPFFAQARPGRMIRLQYKSGHCFPEWSLRWTAHESISVNCFFNALHIFTKAILKSSLNIYLSRQSLPKIKREEDSM